MSKKEKVARSNRGGMGSMSPATDKAKNVTATLAKFRHRLKKYKKKVILVLVFAMLSTVFSIVGPKLLGKITTKLIEGLIAYYTNTGLLTDFDYMGKIASLLIVLYLVAAVCSYVQGYIMSGVSVRLTYELRKEISEKIHRIPLSYYDKRTHGEVLSRVTNDIDTINQTLNQGLMQIITSVVTIIGVLVMMLSISPIMTLVALLIVPLSALLMMVVFKRSQGFFKAQQQSIGQLNGQIEEMYAGHNIVMAFNGEANAIRRFEETNNELYGSAWKSQFVSSMMQPIMMFVGNLGYVVISILGGYLAVKKVVEIGDIQAFIQYMRNFTQPIGQLASVSNTMQSTLAAAERVFEFLEEAEESPEQDSLLPVSEINGSVDFRNVAFGYDPEQLIINNFSARVRPGEKVAIVGPTGAGKTTVVKLLMRFYDINAGTIEVDGINIHQLSRSHLRSFFGMVLQDTWLYNASIRDNLRYGNFEATEEEVIRAAKAAHCHDFIKALPGGYDMVLREDATNISQGQKQLFTIARVILADPKILILDEATSSVDTRTEIQIQQAMDNLMKGRTSFVIAHRLSTIRDADTILVMREGDIIEQGNHEKLLAEGGFYADLYYSQFSEVEGTS